MGLSAEIVILFESPMEVVAAHNVAPGLVAIEDADLHCYVSPEGAFEYKPDPRLSPLLGETSLQGRLWHGSLGRYWSPTNQDYGGNPMTYAKVLQLLEKQPGVQYVWYGLLRNDGGCRDVQPMTDARIASFFGVPINRSEN